MYGLSMHEAEADTSAKEAVGLLACGCGGVFLDGNHGVAHLASPTIDRPQRSPDTPAMALGLSKLCAT